MLETAFFLTALVSLGMALAFVRTDPDPGASPLAMTGFCITTNNSALDPNLLCLNLRPIPWRLSRWV